MRRTGRSLVVAVAVLAALLPAGSAGARGEPFTFATTRDGSLLFASSAIVSPKTVELNGGWNDDSRPCSEMRDLTVSVLVDRVKGATTTRRTFTKTGLVQNCAEGGPNFGYLLKAKALGMGCPKGGWRPGYYTFVTTTTDTTTGILTGTSLAWEKVAKCAA